MRILFGRWLGRASSQESGQRLLAGGQGTECLPSCHWLLPALPPGEAEDCRGGWSGHGPKHGFPISFTGIGALNSHTHLSTHSLTCSQALSLPPSLAVVSGAQVGWPSPGQVAVYCTLKPGLPDPLCDTMGGPSRGGSFLVLALWSLRLIGT